MAVYLLPIQGRWRLRVNETCELQCFDFGQRTVAVEFWMQPETQLISGVDGCSEQFSRLMGDSGHMLAVPLFAIPWGASFAVTDGTGSVVSCAPAPTASALARLDPGWPEIEEGHWPLYAFVDPVGRPSSLRIVTWEAVNLRAAEPTARRDKNEIHIRLRGLLPADGYEFDLLNPPSVRFTGDELEVGLDGGDKVIAHPGTRPTAGGPAQSLVLGAPQIRGDKPRFWAWASPDFSGSWALGPLVVGLECLLTVALASHLQTADAGSITSLLLLTPPVVSAALAASRDTTIARRLFPQFAWIAWVLYPLALVPVGLVAFKATAPLIRAIAGIAAALALVGACYNGIAYIRGRYGLRRRLANFRSLPSVDEDPASQWAAEVAKHLERDDYSVDSQMTPGTRWSGQAVSGALIRSSKAGTDINVVAFPTAQSAEQAFEAWSADQRTIADARNVATRRGRIIVFAYSSGTIDQKKVEDLANIIERLETAAPTWIP